ncbi:MAG TPA: adenylate cyclase regulatory domain-containing protein [Solirubrobacteraceae bacterium]|nr:adenylate cyclase regulatory domain-containing protein [Solirubrobacteraceae bacterium]
MSPGDSAGRGADVDFAGEGLLDGLEDEAQRSARLELLTGLHRDGVSLEELRRAVADERLALLPVERLLAGEAHYTAAQVAERAGVEVERVLAGRRALGLPVPSLDAVAYDDEDVEAALRAEALRAAGISDKGVLELARVSGEAMVRIAETMRTLVAEAFLTRGRDELALGRLFAEFLRVTGPTTGPALAYAFNQHLRQIIASDMVSRAELAEGRIEGGQEVTVCFADLVGFTSLGERIDAEELGAVADRLAEMARDIAVAPVRLVKTIGDAAMFVSREPEPMLDAAIELVGAAEEADDLPQLRAGVALGSALSRGGDWYGRPVNLASRVTGIARAGSVLATEDLRDATGDERYRWSYAGERALKGVRHPIKVYRARVSPAGD